MQAFIIRPFGEKKGIDFDRVEKELIDRSLEALEIRGRTTADSLKQGNIRTEMFQRLLTADLVIVDISIHNANVFYELGIRHALREKRTFIIRCEGKDLPPDEVPFDIRTDRYLCYDPVKPESALGRLTEGLRQTIRSEDQDSPVFQLLPNLVEQDPAHFLVVPAGFREEVERALAARLAGDLDLLATEARGFKWEVEGLRFVGLAQFKLKAWQAACITWERVRRAHPDDLQANLLLGTIHQRLGDIARSDIAVKRVLDQRGLKADDRAEAFSLLARNAKARWKADWESFPAEQQRTRALRSGFLADAANFYSSAFKEYLNHFYSGLNALAMLTIQAELAAALPTVWEDGFDEPVEASRQLEAQRRQRDELSAAVGLSIGSALDRLKRESRTDIWAEISEADLCLLTTKRLGRVTSAYEKALAGADDFAVEAARDQIELYQGLAILNENVQAALSAFPPRTAKGQGPGNAWVLLFTGHRIDDPGRPKPRFPANKEDVARKALRDAIESEKVAAGEIAFGIAGGASGGDILFHEVCGELGISTKLFLAVPPEDFIKASVRSAGPQWIERFWRLRGRISEQRQLSDSEQLPVWLQEKEDYTVWQRNNLWELYNALAAAPDGVTLIALWNGEKGDGPGGTADLVEEAGERGAKTVILDTKQRFGLS